jgi:hypothetical protein
MTKHRGKASAASATAGGAGPRATPAERAAWGKAVRTAVPRAAHAEWDSPAQGRDPVELLEEQARTRVPELVPIRYRKMLES